MSGNPVERLMRWRVGMASEPSPPNELVLKAQQPLYDLVNRFSFRLEVDGWERVPDETSLLVGVHSGATLTMDAWTLVSAWHQPLPAKIRTELLDPIEVDHDPERVDDVDDVQGVYDEVEAAIQAGMDRLATKRRAPVFG